MEYRHDIQSHSYVVSLSKGDDLKACIQNLAKKELISGAMISAIGGLKDPVLGYFDPERRRETKRTWNGFWELLHLSGNISLMDHQPVVNMKAIISGNDFTPHGGHLFEATVGTTVELFITCSQGPIHRLPNDDIGLSQWRPNYTPKA